MARSGSLNLSFLDEQLRATEIEVLAAVFSDADLKMYSSGLAELYMYVPVVDDRTCNICLDNAKLHPLVLGGDIRFLFPYAQQVDSGLWMVLAHPNCRCMLVLQEIKL